MMAVHSSIKFNLNQFWKLTSCGILSLVLSGLPDSPLIAAGVALDFYPSLASKTYPFLQSAKKVLPSTHQLHSRIEDDLELMLKIDRENQFFSLAGINQEQFLRNTVGQFRPQWQLKAVPANDQKLPLLAARTAAVHRTDYRYLLHSVALCDFQIAAFNSSVSGMMLRGHLAPDLEKTALAAIDFPQRADALATIKDRLPTMQVLSAEPCWYFNQERLTPVWDFHVTSQDQSYLLRADDKMIYSIKNLFFDVKAALTSYQPNPNDGSLEETIVDLSGDGLHLDSEFFTTAPYGVNRVSAVNGAFDVKPEDLEFSEISAFVYANQMLDWFKSIGYSWAGSKPMILKSRFRSAGSGSNNALYQPPEASASGSPTIMVGTGDGSILQNLDRDFDVVGHEFGHHILFHTLKETSGESLVLHEGLADYFTFAKTGNTCLGESICPEGSNACVVPASCLRTADNTMRYDDATYASLEAHLKGQLIAATLWDLHEEIGNDAATRIAFTSVNYFLADSGFKDFIVSLFLADKEINNGAKACAIYDVLINRGFSDLMTSIDCNNPASYGSLVGTSPAPAPQPVVKSSSSSGSCGTLASIEHRHSQLPLALIFLLPVAFILARQGFIFLSSLTRISIKRSN